MKISDIVRIVLGFLLGAIVTICILLFLTVFNFWYAIEGFTSISEFLFFLVVMINGLALIPLTYLFIYRIILSNNGRQRVRNFIESCYS
ncbi:hypothetical protein A5819_003706 [Enterococcus sp. 7E2_DIV0204]|nr:hypothetical protein A5819_003706 [Enterococcus sp. 7E2_DIV0204]OTP47550.1 hypothetical protein A5884_003521 [Enterococcus sp. 7D2_DIV0200]